MDADLWAARFAASKRYQPSLQIRSGADLQFNLDDFEDEEDLRAEFPCPFFSENFNIAGLCCHIDEEHSVQAKNGVQRRRKFRKGSSHSTLSLLSKELWEGHLQSLLAASSYPVASSSTVPDPLLSSFIYNMPLVDAPSKQESHLPIEGVSDKKPADEKVTQSSEAPVSDKEQEERARKCSFLQELLLSTLFEDML